MAERIVGQRYTIRYRVTPNGEQVPELVSTGGTVVPPRAQGRRNEGLGGSLGGMPSGQETGKEKRKAKPGWQRKKHREQRQQERRQSGPRQEEPKRTERSGKQRQKQQADNRGREHQYRGERRQQHRTRTSYDSGHQQRERRRARGWFDQSSQGSGDPWFAGRAHTERQAQAHEAGWAFRGKEKGRSRGTAWSQPVAHDESPQAAWGRPVSRGQREQTERRIATWWAQQTREEAKRTTTKPHAGLLTGASHALAGAQGWGAGYTGEHHAGLLTGSGSVLGHTESRSSGRPHVPHAGLLTGAAGWMAGAQGWFGRGRNDDRSITVPPPSPLIVRLLYQGYTAMPTSGKPPVREAPLPARTDWEEARDRHLGPPVQTDVNRAVAHSAGARWHAPRAPITPGQSRAAERGSPTAFRAAPSASWAARDVGVTTEHEEGPPSLDEAIAEARKARTRAAQSPGRAQPDPRGVLGGRPGTAPPLTDDLLARANRSLARMADEAAALRARSSEDAPARGQAPDFRGTQTRNLTGLGTGRTGDAPVPVYARGQGLSGAGGEQARARVRAGGPGAGVAGGGAGDGEGGPPRTAEGAAENPREIILISNPALIRLIERVQTAEFPLEEFIDESVIAQIPRGHFRDKGALQGRIMELYMSHLLNGIVDSSELRDVSQRQAFTEERGGNYRFVRQGDQVIVLPQDAQGMESPIGEFDYVIGIDGLITVFEFKAGKSKEGQGGLNEALKPAYFRGERFRALQEYFGTNTFGYVVVALPRRVRENAELQQRFREAGGIVIPFPVTSSEIRRNINNVFGEGPSPLIPLIRAGTRDRHATITAYDFFRANKEYEHQTGDDERIVQLAFPWYDLQPGNQVIRHEFWLQPAIGEPQQNEITLTINGEILTLHRRSVETGIVLAEPLITEGQMFRIGHARRADGQEVAIRTPFWTYREAIEELRAIQQLESNGYPVPKHAEAQQLFLPWPDTLIYDWIPGESLSSALQNAIAEGDRQKAFAIARTFGTHIGLVWRPLLEGSLPSGQFYNFPDYGAGNFIYNGNPDPAKAFVRIDVGTLSTRGPLGSERYLDVLASELITMFPDRELFTSLIGSVREGFADATNLQSRAGVEGEGEGESQNRVDINELNELVRNRLVRITRHPEAPFAVYNYSERAQHHAELSTPLVDRCRGLIVSDTGEVIAQPFPRITDLRQGDELPSGGFTVTDKLDGTLVVTYEWNGQMHVATRTAFEDTHGRIDRATQQLREYEHLLSEQQRDFSFRPREITYLWEFIDPENPLVVKYGDRESLVLIGMRNIATGKDIPLPDQSEVPFPVVQSYPEIQTIEDLRTEVERRPNTEGFVIKMDNTGALYRIKSRAYEIRNIIRRGLMPQRVWKYALEGGTLDEYIAQAPEEVHEELREITDELQNKYNTIEAEARADYNRRRKWRHPKISSLMQKKQPYARQIWEAIKPPRPER